MLVLQGGIDKNSYLPILKGSRMPIKMGQGGSKSQNIASYCEVTGKSTIQLSSHSKREGIFFFCNH